MTITSTAKRLQHIEDKALAEAAEELRASLGSVRLALDAQGSHLAPLYGHLPPDERLAAAERDLAASGGDWIGAVDAYCCGRSSAAQLRSAILSALPFFFPDAPLLAILGDLTDLTREVAADLVVSAM